MPLPLSFPRRFFGHPIVDLDLRLRLFRFPNLPVSLRQAIVRLLQVRVRLNRLLVVGNRFRGIMLLGVKDS